MIKVGLTGNIGTGKSTVAEIFSNLGVPLHHADEVSKSYLQHPDVQQKLLNRFGDELMGPEGIDRTKLAKIVFESDEALSFLNGLLHPLVRENLDKWFNAHTHEKYVIQEAAILFESDFYKAFDKIIVVSCPQTIAIERVMARDEVDKEKVLMRMRKQWSQDKKILLADFVIENDGKKLLLPQIVSIHEKIISLV